MKRTSARMALLCMAVVAVLAIAAAPASAITYGAPDGVLHPNVGALVAAPSAGPGPAGIIYDGGQYAISSGTLIAPRVFLIAGHSVELLHARGVTDTQVWVTFDPVFARGVSSLIPGTMHANPNFSWLPSDPNDVAVVTFARDVNGIPLAKLPSAGMLDQMAAKGGLQNQTFTLVGYGMQEATFGDGPPVFGPSGTRRFVTSGFNALTPSHLHTSANPALGYGGSNMFDSGGPEFLRVGDADVIAAIAASGDAMARAMNIGNRLDTPAARAYLDDFVALP